MENVLSLEKECLSEERLITMDVKKNYAYQLGYEAFVLLLPLVVSPYIARVLGAEGIGEYAFSSTIAQYFVLFAMLGIKNYGNRLIAQSRDSQDQLNRAFSSLAVVHVLISLFVILAYCIYCEFAENRSYALLQWPLVISALFDISWFYHGMEMFKLPSLVGSGVKIISAALIFCFVHQQGDLWKYCLIMAAGFLFNQLVLWIPLKKYVSFVRPTGKELRDHCRPLVVLFIPAIAVSLYKYMDKIMIGALSDKTQLGFYQNADTAIGTPLRVVEAFGSVMLPKMSYLARAERKEEADNYLRLSMKYVMALTFALTFGLAGVATVFAPVFWGAEFAASGTLMMWLAITVPFIAFSNVIRTQYLLPNNRDWEFVLSVSAGAVVNIAVNWLLIPKMGAFGATLGTIAAEILVCVIQVYAVRKELGIGTYIRNCIPFFMIGLVMFFLVFSVRKLGGSSVVILIIQVLLGVTLFGVLSWLYLFLTKDELLLNARGKLKEKFKRIHFKSWLLWAALFLELLLAVPYDYLSSIPLVKKALYLFQGLAAFIEILMVARLILGSEGGFRDRLKRTINKYHWVSVFLILFVLYNWIVTIAMRSEPFVTAAHYFVQMLILVLGVSRTFRAEEKTTLSATAWFFWIAIIANSLLFILKPSGLYTSVTPNGSQHICFLFGLDNQFGKIYFAGFALIWYYEEINRRGYFMTLSSLLLMLYGYFHWYNGTGMLVCILLSLMILVFNLKWLRFTLSLKLFLLGIAVFFFAVCNTNGTLYGGGKLIQFITGFTQKSVNFSYRLEIWSKALEMFRVSPIIGYGRVAENAHVLTELGLFNAHNQIMQVLLDGGLIGLVFFVLPFVYTDWRSSKRLKEQPEIRILYIGIFTSLVYFMMEVGTMLPMFLCLLLACLTADDTNTTHSEA